MGRVVRSRVRSMIVSRLEISGFRGIRDGLFDFQSFTALFGANNCGKTTITEALALVLGRDRLVRPLTEHDFYGSTPAEADRIKIVASITGFAGDDPDAYTDWFRWGRATQKWQDAETGEIKPENSKANDRLACQIGFVARFDHESLETVAVRYFYDAEVDPFEEDAPIVIVPVELIRQIGFFLVPASRTWDRTISFGSELFRRVVSYVGGKPAAAVLAERGRLRNPPEPLEEDDNLCELVSKINADIRALFGRPNDLKLRVTSTDSDGILEAIVPHFSAGAGVPIPSRRHGSGLISFQVLILLMRFGRTRVALGDGFMMVIEEPELHVPPPLQRKLLRMFQSMATQTIVTTHSPTVASVPDAHEIYLVVNSSGSASSRPLSKTSLAVDAVSPVRGLLLSDRDATVTALMHQTVLIPEGKTDANWLRLFVKILELSADANDEGALQFAHEIGIIPTREARCTEVFVHLQPIHPHVVCLFDGDGSGDNYTAACCRLPAAPRIIVRWPVGWAIENVVAWIIAVDPAILHNADLAASGVPADIAQFSAAFAGALKSDEIVHAQIADAIMTSAASRRRVAHILKVLGGLAAGRQIDVDHATAAAHRNGRTTVWTVNHAIRGI